MLVRQRPTSFDAWQWRYHDDRDDDPEWLFDAIARWPGIGGVVFELRQRGGADVPILWVKTELGITQAREGDYLLRSSETDIQVCTPEYFAAHYLALDAPITEPSTLTKHDPEAGSYGDCFRCCLAALLRLAVVDVPHFMTPPFENVYERLDEWLKPLGLAYVQWPLNPEIQTVDALLESIERWISGEARCAFLFGGKSSKGVDHFVVCQGSQIVYDSTGNGIVAPNSTGYYYVGFLALRT